MHFRRIALTLESVCHARQRIKFRVSSAQRRPSFATREMPICLLWMHTELLTPTAGALFLIAGLALLTLKPLHIETGTPFANLSPLLKRNVNCFCDCYINQRRELSSIWRLSTRQCAFLWSFFGFVLRLESTLTTSLVYCNELLTSIQWAACPHQANVVFFLPVSVVIRSILAMYLIWLRWDCFERAFPVKRLTKFACWRHPSSREVPKRILGSPSLETDCLKSFIAFQFLFGIVHSKEV